MTCEDFNRLVELLKDELLGVIAALTALRQLASELHRATIVDTGSVPADVVTMNSTAKLTDFKSQATDSYTQVYPEDANIAKG